MTGGNEVRVRADPEILRMMACEQMSDVISEFGAKNPDSFVEKRIQESKSEKRALFDLGGQSHIKNNTNVLA